jgi:hypothetical protein
VSKEETLLCPKGWDHNPSTCSLREIYFKENKVDYGNLKRKEHVQLLGSEGNTPSLANIHTKFHKSDVPVLIFQ